MPKHFRHAKVNRYVLAGALFHLAFAQACSEAPTQAPLRAKAADAEASENNGNGSEANPVVTPTPKPAVPAPAPIPSTSPVTPMPAQTGSDGKPVGTEASDAEKAKAAALALLERVPEGCEGKGTVTDKDVVLFNGEDVKFDANGKNIAINQGWKIDGYWGNGRIGVEKKRNQPAIFFDNETFYHGFDITPPSVNGQRKTFTMKGFDVYYDSSKTSAATFGLRIIKPGENEGAGDNEKRSWFKLDAAGAGKDADVANAKIDAGNCKLTHFYTTKVFLDQNLVSNRFIWELMTNWNPADKLYVYKIVLKDFQWK